MRHLWTAIVLMGVSLPYTSFAQQIVVGAESAQLAGPDLHLVLPIDPSQSPAPDPAVTPAPKPPAEVQPVPGKAFVTGFLKDSDHADFTVKVPSSGFYDLDVAFRSIGTKGYNIAINGLEISGTISATPNHDFVSQRVGMVELEKGSNVVQINKGWGFFDVASIQLTLSEGAVKVTKAPAKAVDAQLTPEATALLGRLDTSYGKTTMLGVYSDDDAQYVSDQTGALPAIMGGDLLSYSPQEVAHGSHPEKKDEVGRLIAKYRAGYVVTLSWHWCSPSGLIDSSEKPWWRGFYTDSTNFDLEKTLADPTSTDYATMLSDIDAIAVQLRKLQDAHVPILWRPLHEASGGWFWWGAKGPKPFVKLWQLLYDRLTNVDGIHNLIWVYTGDGNTAWYPGDSYVDIIGIDAYPKDLRDPQSQLWTALQRSYGDRKILAISEFGGVPDVPRMQRMGEFWSYAVSWSGKEGPKKNTPDDLKQIYSSPSVTTIPLTTNKAPL